MDHPEHQHRLQQRATGSHHSKTFVYLVYAAVVGVILLIGSLAYAYMRIFALNEELRAVNTQLAATNAALDEKTDLLAVTIDEMNSSFSETLSSTEKSLQERVNEVNSKVGTVEQTVGQVSGTVTTLEKLSKTDPELLQKYSKVFFLNEHYMPERVSEVPNQYKYYEDRNYTVHASVWPYLQRMLNDAKNAGVNLWIYSAYRGFDEQGALKNQYKVIYGEGTANQFSADQGYSEHQLGTTVDLITSGLGGQLEGFEQTTAYQWLNNNAHRYGFVLSYPPGNQHYTFEPWHWRFVGVKLATYLHNQGKHFYDLDQRTIDEYLTEVFE